MDRYTIFMDQIIQHKMSIAPKLIHRFDEILIKIATRLFVDRHKLILKFAWKGTETRITKTILEKKNKMIEITLLCIKIY